VETEQDYEAYVTSRIAGLRRLGYHLCGSTSGADDLVQETITKLYVLWPRIRTVDDLDAYTRTVLVRTFLSERRRPWSRLASYDSPTETEALEPDADLRLLLRAALARVPRRQRAVLVLRFLCDLSVEEAARHLNCSAGTVKSQTSHGLKTMRRLLETAAFALTERA
jgi:RNA polymerase sigma-70 factor (sigma-E family)